MLPFLIWSFGVIALSLAQSDENGTLLAERQVDNDNPCNCYFKESCGCICSRPITWAQFQVLPQNFRPCRGFTLALRGGQFFAFPGDYFYRVGHVSDFVLDVSRVALQYLNDPQAQSSPYNGVTFDISAFVRMHEVIVNREWNWDAMYWLAPTTTKAYCEIQVVQSTVPVLRADFGRICQGYVTVVNIVSSGLISLDNGVFAPFYKLTEIDLSNNRIQEMRRSYFLILQENWKS
uniref:U56-Eretoxin-Ek1a_1 n=1 Tax=Eresus cinnaberinus TaxID=175337 RepID=A0A2D0PCN2_ERECI